MYEAAPDQPSIQRCYSWETDAVVGPLLDLSEKLSRSLNVARANSLSSSSPTLASSQCCYADPGQTIVFLDWDDTVFPTTELFEGWGFSSRSLDEIILSDEQERELATWSRVLHQYLATACGISERCVILTNAKRPWVEQCIDRFAPDLRPLFDDTGSRLRVVYAREALVTKRSARPVRYAQDVEEFTSKDEYDEHLTQTKFAAMQRETKEFYSQYPSQTWKNIVSIGDSRYEHDAIQEVAFQRDSPKHERIRLKTIITPIAPSVRDLTYRLRLGLVLWPAWVHYDGDVDLDLNTPERLQAIANALELPELTDAIHPTPIIDDDEDAVEESLDDVAAIVQSSLCR